VAVSPDGHVYVCDTDNYRVQKFTLNGEFVLEFGGPSAQPASGMFYRGLTRDGAVLPGPMGLACDSNGNVYVTDTWANQIQKFDPTGEFVTAWKSPGPGDFFGPRDIAVDAEDLIYVADTGNKRIQVFDPNGTIVRTIGRGGAGPAEFDEPVGIDLRQNELYVADVGNKRIQVVRPGGGFVRQWNVCGWETPVVSSVESYLATAPDSTVYVTDSIRNCVYQFDPRGNSAVLWGTEGSGPGQLRRPTGIAVDQEGFVYVADMGNHRVNKYRKY
jgi:DNA-binding beta-propeller fold protein YncE